ncbi:hypothetical protein [Marinomonas epiphytica]
MKFSWDQVEKIFRLFFPEFSNKVTWTVVGAGLALTSTPFVEAIIRAIIEENFKIEILGSNDGYIGLTLVAFGLIHNIVLQREKNKLQIAANVPEDNSEQREHDKKVFNYLNGVMDENILNTIFDTLERDHAYFYSRYDAVEKFMHEINNSENSYADQDLCLAVDVLKESAIKFNAFLINNFHQLSHGTNDEWMCLHPYWNCDRGGQFGDREQERKYEAFSDEMYKLVKEHRENFRAYRKLVKVKLAI